MSALCSFSSRKPPLLAFCSTQHNTTRHQRCPLKSKTLSFLAQNFFAILRCKSIALYALSSVLKTVALRHPISLDLHSQRGWQHARRKLEAPGIFPWRQRRRTLVLWPCSCESFCPYNCSLAQQLRRFCVCSWGGKLLLSPADVERRALATN